MVYPRVTTDTFIVDRGSKTGDFRPLSERYDKSLPDMYVLVTDPFSVILPLFIYLCVKNKNRQNALGMFYYFINEQAH